MNPNSNTSRGGKIQFQITLILSDVPTVVPEQVFFYNLEQAIRSILGISMEWNISISVGDISIERRLFLTSNVVISIVFTSLSAGPGDILALQSKLNSPAFLDQLNSLGFKASKASLKLASTSNDQASSSLIVGLCSAAGVLTSLALLFCLARRFFGRARGESKKNVKSGTFDEGSFAECSLEISGDTLDKDKANEAIADSNCIMTGILSGIDQISEVDYSKEFDELLQLIARLAISIKSLVDPLLRKEIEATVQHSNDITAHDCAAALQLISKIELDDKSLVHTPDRKKLFQQRISEGPLTENHLLVLKLLCEADSEVTSMNMNEDKAFEVLSTQTIQCASHSQLEITEDKISESCDKPLLDVLKLLKNCSLEPSYLMQNESRKMIEDNLTLRKGPLLAEHLAVLQLISKAEIDSGLSIDSMRQNLLKKRIEEGPLNADHLKAALSLHLVEKGELHDVTQMNPVGHAETRSELETNQLYAAYESHQAKQYESCEVSNVVGGLVFSSGHDALAQEIKSQSFMDTISGLEVRSSLLSILSREEKSALQLMELRAKTARIRQSLPEWVRNGLVPPLCNRSPPAVPAGSTPLAAVLAENIANCSDSQAGRGAVQISCNVQADLGFLNDFMPAAVQPKLQQEAKESLFLHVDQYADITRVEQQPESASSWQAEPLAGEVLRLSPTPSLGIGSSLAWLFCSLSNCVSNCLLAVMGSCCSGLGCQTSLVSGNRD